MTDKIQCPECGKPVTVSDLNVGVINEPNISLMHCVHATGIDCICGAHLRPMIVNLPPGIFAWVAIERPSEQRVEVPRIQLAH